MKKVISTILAVLLLFAFASSASAQITKDGYYARSALSGNELEAYDYFYNQLSKGSNDWYESFGLNRERIHQISQYVYYDSPEHLGGYTGFSNSEIEQTDQKADEILNLLSEDMTNYEKVKTLYYWLAKNIVYGENEEAGDQGQTIVGALVYGEAVCGGITAALQYLLYQVDIPCYTVTGTHAGGPHGWNIIQIDGQWYNADLTDDLGYPGGVFLFGDAIFAGSHQADPDLNPPLPECPENYVEPTPEPTPTPTVEQPTPELTMAAKITEEPASEAVETQETGPGEALWYALGGAVVVAVLLAIWAVRRKKRTYK